VASAYALLNQREQALKYLNDVGSNGFPCYPLFTADKNLDNLRGRDDFTAFLARQKDLYETTKKQLAPPPGRVH
jgi:hypothetical protein